MCVAQGRRAAARASRSADSAEPLCTRKSSSQMHHNLSLLAALLVLTVTVLLRQTEGLLLHPLQMPRRGASSSTPSLSSTQLQAQSNSAAEIEGYSGTNARVYIGRGMERFTAGRVQDSISDFDRALELQPSLSPYLWQRGLSMYYADRFEDGAAQFRRDVSVNPNDTEEAIWAFACEARAAGGGADAVAAARKRMLKVGRDPRPYMRTAYSLFAGDASEEELARVGHDGSPRADFYARLYLALYAECRSTSGNTSGDSYTALARQYMTGATEGAYARGADGGSGDYMVALARVHRSLRGW